MTNELALWLAIGAGVLAVLYGLVSVQWILKQPAGNERMQQIQLAIQEGANAYMNRQYFTIGVVGVVLFVILGVALGWHTAIGFAIAGELYPGIPQSPVIAGSLCSQCNRRRLRQPLRIAGFGSRSLPVQYGSREFSAADLCDRKTGYHHFQAVVHDHRCHTPVLQDRH